MADFDFFPQKNISTINQPIVQKKHFQNEDFKSIEYNSYLVSPGECDIFFQTNFEHLKRIYLDNVDIINEEVHQSKFMKQSQFLKMYLEQVDLKQSETKSGYNPILEDYSNFSIFLGSISNTKLK